MKVKLWGKFESDNKGKRDYDTDSYGVLCLGLCPVCKYWEKPQNENTATHPMILCGNCDACVVIDIFSRQEITPSQDELDEFMSERNDQQGLYKFFSCDLYKILRVTNYQTNFLTPAKNTVFSEKILENLYTDVVLIISQIFLIL